MPRCLKVWGGGGAGPSQFPLVVTMGDWDADFGGEPLGGKSNAVPRPVIAKEDAAGAENIPPDDEILVNVFLLVGSVKVDQVGSQAIQREPLGGGKRRYRKGGDAVLPSGTADVGEKLVVEGWVAVPEAEGSVAFGIGEVSPHFQSA